MKKNILTPQLRQILTRSLSVVFILFFLFCEGMANFHIIMPPITLGSSFPEVAYRALVSVVVNLWAVGTDFSIAEHWTMYQFADPVDTQLLILGIKHDGLGVVLPIPTQSSRNALESNLIDYHENKLLEGCFRYPDLRGMIAKSMCHQYGKQYDLKSIMFVEVVRKILPREESKKLHQYYDSATKPTNRGLYPCND